MDDLAAAAEPVDPSAWSAAADRRLRRAAADGDSQGVADAVAMFSQVWVGTNAESDPNHAVKLINFVNALLGQFETTGLVSALTQAADLLDRHEDVCPAGHRHRVDYLRAIGRALLRDGQRTGERRALERAVAARRDAYRLSGRGTEYGLELGSALIHLYAITGSARDVDEAVAILEAMARRTGDAATRASALSGLGQALLARFLRGANTRPNDLARAMDAHDKAVDIAPMADPNRGLYLSELGAARIREYEHTGDTNVLSGALDLLRDAVAVTADGHVEATVRLLGLGNALWTTFDRTCDFAVLDEAITIFRMTSGKLGPDHAYYARCLYSLGAALFRRSQRRGTLFDLDESSVLAETAYQATELTHPDRPTRLSLFALATAARAAVAGMSAWHRADTQLQQAIDLLPQDDPARLMLLSNRGVVLEALGRPAIESKPSEARIYLETAVRVTLIAVEQTPVDHVEYAGRLANFAVASASLARHLNDSMILDEPARLTAAQRDHNGTATALPQIVLTHAAVLECRYDLTGDQPSLIEALSAYQLYRDLPGIDVGHRLSAAFDGGSLAARSGNVDVAVDLLAYAVTLLETVVWRGMDRRDHERLLQQYGALPADAAAMAIAAGHLDRAVGILEQGRGVLLYRRMDDEADLAVVRAHDPALADQVEDLRARLDEIIVPDVEADDVDLPPRPPHQASPMDLRSACARELEHAIEQARTATGWQGLFRSPHLTDARWAASQGPIAMVNVSTYRCDALTITAQELAHTPLADVGKGDVERYARFFRTDAAKASRVDDTGHNANAKLIVALKWLWDMITSHVLNDLGIVETSRPDEMSPHLYWCPVGDAAFLPLHAAGYHSTTDQRPESTTVIDLAASSYIPKLRGMTPGGRNHTTGPALQDANDLLIVSMPMTPGHPDLPNAAAEAEYLLQTFPSATHLSATTATVDAVIAALSTHPKVHFSVHGVTNTTTPLDSGLELDDGRLTIRQLSTLHLRHAEWVFLSACSTYQGAPGIPDEGITLGTTFQNVGFGQVIATLWPISDNHSLAMVAGIYDRVTSRGVIVQEPWDDGAYALRDTAREIRDQHPDQPYMWAPFIHTAELTMT
jgi:tetratricopeptide (TPR) repeat protein